MSLLVSTSCMRDSSQPVVVVADHICCCSSSQCHQHHHHTCFVLRLCVKGVAKNGFMYQSVTITVTKYNIIYRLGLGWLLFKDKLAMLKGHSIKSYTSNVWALFLNVLLNRNPYCTRCSIVSVHLTAIPSLWYDVVPNIVSQHGACEALLLSIAC